MSTQNMVDAPFPLSATKGGLGVASPTAHGILIGEGASAVIPIVLSAGQILIGTTASDPAAASLTPGIGISIASVTGSITINATGGGLSWSTVTAGTLSAAINNGYVLNHAATACVVTFPATAALGSKISLKGLSGSGGWTATANTGQTIQFGNVSSSSGGSFSSTDATDSAEFICIVANTTWDCSNCVSAGLTVV